MIDTEHADTERGDTGPNPVRGLVAGTTPYPWPYDAALSRSRTALIVVGWNQRWWERSDDPAGVGVVARPGQVNRQDNLCAVLKHQIPFRQ